MTRTMIHGFALALCASAGAAQQVELTIDDTTSTAAAELCLDAGFFGSDCDTDTSGVSGTISIELDDGGAPTMISIHDFNAVLDDGLDATLTAATFNLNGNIPTASAFYTTPGAPTGPVPITAGAFTFSAVSTSVSGTGTISGTALGFPVSDSIDLSGSEPVDATIDGTIMIVGTAVTVTATVEFTSVLPITDPISAEVSVDASITINATGEIASKQCPGDLTTTGTSSGNPGFGEPDGTTDLSDLLYFVNVWQADSGTPSPNPGSLADVTTTGSSAGGAGFGTPDGNVDLSDLLFFVNEWDAGRVECP